MSEKISAMPQAGPITGAELVPLVQGGANVHDSLGSIFVQLGQQILASITYYVSPTGNDANNGLTPATPKTLQGGINMVNGATLAAGVIVTIQMLDGLYNLTSQILIPFYFGTGGYVVIQGNLANRIAVVVDDSPGYTDGALFGFYNLGSYSFEFKSFVLNASNSGPFASMIISGGRCFIGDNFGIGPSNTTVFHFYISTGGYLAIAGNCNRYFCESSVGGHMRADSRSQIDFIVNGSFTFDTNGHVLNFGNFIQANALSYVGCFSPNTNIPVSGTVTGVRCDVTSNSVYTFFSGNQNTFFPGNTNGTASTGGIFA